MVINVLNRIVYSDFFVGKVFDGVGCLGDIL